MWTREKRPNNMVVNDPKGELLCKFYVKGTVRGFQVVQFNLINAIKTDIYNPLVMAADAAREGDFTKCATYVEAIADVFFPTDGGEDPVWPNAANNAFKRAVYGLIDYYLEEERELRLKAEKINMEQKVLDAKLDVMWGKVTLYTCYQLFVQLSSKKLPNPKITFKQEKEAYQKKLAQLEERAKAAGSNGGANEIQEKKRRLLEEYSVRCSDEKAQSIEKQSVFWENKPECDLLTLYFNATDLLPKNSMRTLVSNANNALRSMSGAEKMLASVYGIAITAMVRHVRIEKGYAWM